MFARKFARLFGGFTALVATPLLCTSKKSVYIWGNGQYQARPDALLQFENFTPKKVVGLPEDLSKLQFGEYYEAGVTEKGVCYIWKKKSLDANLDKTRQDNQRENIQQLATNIKEIRFTQGYIWALTISGDVLQWPIIKIFDDNNIVKETKIGEKRVVEPLKGSTQIETGEDHVITLSKQGEVYAMGDDTYGQCGQADTTRATHPPWTELRFKSPVLVKNLKKIIQIASGGNHCLALDENGNLFGWGSNITLQLSHEEEHSRMNTPLLCSFVPLRISKGLDNYEIKNIVAGDEFSIVVTENRGTHSSEVFSFGNNLRGQLGIGEIRHIRDVTRIEGLSNYILKVGGQEQKVKVEQIACGKQHCIASLNIGYVMEWGDNEFGQMGNKKRSSVYTPILIREFANTKVVGVFAGDNNSGVILEEEDSEAKKKNKKVN